jgi:hypothetical protein
MLGKKAAPNSRHSTVGGCRDGICGTHRSIPVTQWTDHAEFADTESWFLAHAREVFSALPRPKRVQRIEVIRRDGSKQFVTIRVRGTREGKWQIERVDDENGTSANL